MQAACVHMCAHAPASVDVRSGMPTWRGKMNSTLERKWRGPRLEDRVMVLPSRRSCLFCPPPRCAELAANFPNKRLRMWIATGGAMPPISPPPPLAPPSPPLPPVTATWSKATVHPNASGLTCAADQSTVLGSPLFCIDIDGFSTADGGLVSHPCRCTT